MASKSKIFPTVKGKSDTSPVKGECTWCRRLESKDSFIVLSNLCTSERGPEPKGLVTQLNLEWQAYDRLCTRYGKNLAVSLPIADAVRGGGFAINFCGVGCLRKYFISMSDQLAAQIESVLRQADNKRKKRTRKKKYDKVQ